MTNPGSFRIPVEMASEGGISDPRNGALMRMALMAGFVERIGSGIRMMENTRRSGGILDLSIEERTFPFSSVTVTISLIDNDVRLTARQKDILNIMKEEPRTKIAELSEKMGVSEKTVRRDIAVLEECGLLEKTGARGGWAVRRRVRLRHGLPSVIP
ncbi:MAG: DeoR family transcriptional regulator [Candidatus Methanomethylophilaceae archaeon]|nr:DeoR family transcriptional regulator [Candidatus Methanomethylophilaceae archaeon]